MHCLEDTQGSAQSLYSSNFYNKIKVYIWIFFFLFLSDPIPWFFCRKKKKSPSFQKKKLFSKKNLGPVHQQIAAMHWVSKGKKIPIFYTHLYK